MDIDYKESLDTKELQRSLINQSIDHYLSKGGVIQELPSLDDETSQSLLQNLEDYAQFQHLDSSVLAKSSKIADGH